MSPKEVTVRLNYALLSTSSGSEGETPVRTSLGIAHVLPFHICRLQSQLELECTCSVRSVLCCKLYLCDQCTDALNLHSSLLQCIFSAALKIPCSLHLVLHCRYPEATLNPQSTSMGDY